MKLSIITPLFNRMDLTTKFISSLAQYMTKDTELILVNNGSSDNTLGMLRQATVTYRHFPITILSLPENVGFGTANNLGAKLAGSENLLFISNDVQILGDVVSTAFEALTQYPRDIVGPRVINVDSGWNTFDRFGTISYVEGFCFAVNKTNFNMVGGFDGNIFIDMEDLELCLRLHLAGIGLRQIAFPVMHELGGSFAGLNKARLDFTLRSLAYVEEKWHMKLIRK